MTLRIIVLASDKKSGLIEARNVGIKPVAVVTPRSPHAARGITADRIMDATSLSVEDRERLLPHALPSIATARKEPPPRPVRDTPDTGDPHVTSPAPSTEPQ